MFDKRLMTFVPQAKKHIFKNVLFQWLSLLFNAILMTGIAVLLNHIIFASLTSNILFSTACAIVFSLICRHLLTRLAFKESYLAAADVKMNLRKKIYRKLAKLGPSYLENDTTSEVIQAAVEGVEQLEVYFSSYMPQFFYAMLAPVTLFFILINISFKAALILLISTPLIPLSIVAVQKIAKRLLASYWGQYTQLGDSFLENLQGLTTLKIYSADEVRHKVMNKEAEKFRRVTMRVLTMQLNSISVMDLIAYGGSAIGIILALHEYRTGTINFIGAFLIVMLAAEFFLPMRALGSYFHVAMNGMAASRTIFKLLGTKEPKWGDATLPAQTPFDLTGNAIYYAYKKDQPVLNDIELRLSDKGMVAIVGESGSGKSTIAGILAGFNTNYGGSIKLCGIELASLSQRALNQAVCYIGSNSYLFKGTVFQQLQMGNPKATEQDMWSALEAVQLKSFIAEQGGLSFELSERASNLSGGQRQRLALARALLKDSDLYIFDEATSNIDVESENAILAVLHELKQKKSILLISHRLANSVEADWIYVLKKGQLVEYGTHQSLYDKKELYSKLWQTQYDLEHFSENTQVAQSLAIDIEKELAHKDKQPTNKPVAQNKATTSWSIMMRLVVLVKPLVPFMIISIIMGVLGFLAAIFIPILGGYGIVQVMHHGVGTTFNKLTTILIVCAVLRGILRYIEQMSNHYIAFKLLAKIRDSVFSALRQLAPAKLEVKDRGNLISLITSDIELLEVFYAHTISPIGIALITVIVMALFIGYFHPFLGLIALIAYTIVGVVLPIRASKKTKHLGQTYRQSVGALNSFFLESLRGIKQMIQFNVVGKRLSDMDKQAQAMHKTAYQAKLHTANYAALTGFFIPFSALLMLIVSYRLYANGSIAFNAVIISTITMFSSFGPVIALANLGTGLSQTLASGERVLAILDEVPAVQEVQSGQSTSFDGIKIDDVDFSYGKVPVLSNLSFEIKKGETVGIIGQSGSGKSTLLKLMMRFWDVDRGQITLSNIDVKALNTSCLRNLESFMTQETHLFKGTIKDNILLAKPEASDFEVITACQKASVHKFIESLPEGYQSDVGELGDTLSGGERQRIGLARAFLHNAPLLLLDEPTSNLDSLNEAVILKAIREDKARTTVLVSHRISTMKVADRFYQFVKKHHS